MTFVETIETRKNDIEKLENSPPIKSINYFGERNKIVTWLKYKLGVNPCEGHNWNFRFSKVKNKMENRNRN